MTKIVICLLFFGLFTIQTVGQMNSDPAPGRSPGPPIATSTLSIAGSTTVQNDVNASEIKQIPIELTQKQFITIPGTTTNTTTSRELINKANLKPTSTINEQQIEINVPSNDIIINKSHVNRTITDTAEYVNELVDQKFNDDITMHAADVVENFQINNVTYKENLTTANNNEFIAESDTSCNDMTDFLKDVVIIDKDAQTQSQSAEEVRLNIDLHLEHDVFDTQTPLGITCGLMYKVRLKTSLIVLKTSKYAAHYSGEFLVEIVSAKTGRERGIFVGHILGNSLPISWFSNLHRYNKDAGGTLLPLSNNKNSTGVKWTQGNNANTAKSSNKACPDNKWRDSAKSHTSSRNILLLNSNRSAVESTESVNMWMINELCEHDDTIEFRVFFRAALHVNSNTGLDKPDVAAGGDNEGNIVEAQHMVFKKTFQYPLHKDCQLILREMPMGTLEYTSLPLYSQDCLVHFPSYEHYQKSTSNTPPPGILVAMQRLNVPCNNGGFVRFSESSTNLCGKLEELPDAERNYHIDVRRRATVRFYKNPMFSLNYKLVDYCYNVTSSNESADYYIQPQRRDSLECYFRIHVPYGNRILLRLVTNNDSAILSHTDVQANWAELNGNGNIFPGVGAVDEDVIYTSQGTIDTQVINLTLSSLTTPTTTTTSRSNSGSNINSYSNNYGYDALTLQKRIWDDTQNVGMSTNRGSNNNNNNNDSNNNKNMDNNYNNAQILGTASCHGIIIKVLENDHAKWSHCVNSTKYARGFLIESTGNMLIVHLYRAAISMADITNTRLRSRVMLSEAFISDSAFTDSTLPAIYLSYQARPIPELAANCEFSWIAMQQFCVTAIEKSLSWRDAEQHCTSLGGHLASIRNEMQQNIMNNLLLHSPGYRDENAYWIGGSDSSYEGDFRWNDGLQFQYTNWFSGWEEHGHYNKQPNDDGLSSQDCIEMRRYFRLPPGVQTNRSPLTSSYMWNDRDCNSKNFLICERAMSDESLLRTWINDCNKTVSLTKEHPRASIWSPSFPRQYPDNANCFTTITAPAGYRIVLEFEELVIETEPGCTYDYLEISEPINVEQSSTKSAKNLKQFFSNNINNNKKKSTTKTITNDADKIFRKRNSYEKSYVEMANENNIINHNNNDNDIDNNNKNNDLNNVINKNGNDASDNYLHTSSSYNNFNNLAQTNYQKLLHIFSSLYKQHTNFIIQTPDYPKGNPYFHHHTATRSGVNINEEILPKRLCGDWSSKLKLLRYVSTGSYLGLHFLSDYSHHFGGYKAKTYMENTASECANERLKPYNGSCYLFVSYPEVDWWTAQQVCRAMGAKLSSVASADEHRFITSNIRNQIDYSPQLIYWLGAELEKNGQFEWTDDTKMSFQGWLPGQGQFNELPTDATCLGLQWKMSPTPMLPSGLYWQSQKCNKIGGYVCKKPKESFGNFAFNNFTVTGTEGRLVSPAYPNSYPLNINYWIHIKSPERTRIVVQFQKIDLEPQDECLYDFVSIQDYDSTIRLEPGINAIPMAMLTSEEENLENEELIKGQQLNFKNMLLENNDDNLYAGNRILSNLQQLQRRKRLQQRIRQRRRRRRRRRSISATETYTVSAKKRNANAQNDFHLLMAGNENESILKQQQSSIKLKRNAENVFPATYAFNSDIESNINKANNNKNINELRKDLNNIKKSIGKSNAVKRNENPKRRRRKRNTTTEIENQLNKMHEKRKRRNTSGGNNNSVKGSKAALDNAQTFLPYVRWCGSHDANMSKFDFVANANELVLNFHSDYSISGLGFSAVWKAIDVSACPLQTLTSREGSIFSPNYPHFVLNNLDCTYIIQAPVGNRVWLEFKEFDLRTDALLELDLGNGIFRPFHHHQHINDGIFVSLKEQLRVHYRTGQHPRGKGFLAIYHTVGQLEQRERVINLTSNATGYLYQLNYPHAMPETVDYTQHLVAPFGDNILLELHGVVFSESFCIDNNVLEIYDNYAGFNGTKWQLCKFPNTNLSTGNSDYDELKIFKKILVDDNADDAENGNDNLDDDENDDDNGQMNGRSMERSYRKHAGRHSTYHHNSRKTVGRQLALQAPPVFITSYLNTLHIRQRTSTKAAANLNATVRVQWDNNLKLKLVWDNKAVESCQPNPCQNSGKCVVNNGTSFCQCQGHFTGRFCGLTLCELDPCIFGKCELTTANFKCHCQPGYMGTTCEQKQRPCAENPCEGRGMCYERNGGFFCRCHAWWEGHRCERRMLHIPYKPLSERMLQEPFWLGLITVFVVMAVIGLVWCAKRHFPEKIEKLLAEEADRNRPPGSAHGHHHHTSLREQLQFTSAIPQPTAVNNAGGSQRSIFNRLGIRKPSLLSLSSPNPTPSGGGAAARTFSLDDLLRPPPRRSPSPRKKRNNSTPVKKCAGDKIEILQHLVSPVTAAAKPKVSLGELISMSENRLRTNIDSESDLKETTFSEHSGSTGSAQITRIVTDPKLEKKVTFARLLNKVSAEMSSGSEIDIGHLAAVKNSSALSLPTDIQFRTCSMPPSPCTNDLRSPHSTNSSNQGSESLSSSDLALTDFGLRSMQTSSNDMGSSMNNSMVGLPLGNLTSRYRIGTTTTTTFRPKVSSADSLLAMFRHLAIASASTSTTSTHTIVTANAATANTPHSSNIIPSTSNFIPPPTITTSVLMSPSATPTVSSPQDDAPGDDESSTSSMYTPVSYSSGLSDSPILYRHQTTIEVPVLDALNAHRATATTSGSSSSSGSNLLHPPTILLEIPGSGMNNKCLSPIRELPTPMPSPALTPIMPRPQRVESPIFQDDPLSVDADYTDDDDDDMKTDDQSDQLSDNIRIELPRDPPVNQIEPEEQIRTTNITTDMFRLPPQQPNARNLPMLRLLPATPTSTSPVSSPVPPRILAPLITIDIEPPTPEEKAPRPRDLIIPTLMVEQPSPTKNRHPLIIYPGSPPPQRASIGETSFMFPNKQQQKRLLKQYEKPTSLDFSCVPPMITVTANMSEFESDDTDPLSPAPKSSGSGGLMPPNPVGMCYLSPFTMCSRADRTISESNLSSSGYSSMASPGPSRCGSSNPLCPNEMDENGSIHTAGGLTLHVNLLNRRKNAALASCKEHIHNGQSHGTSITTAGHMVNQLERLRNQQRPLSDSETLSDDIVHESNDEGISTDHVDEKLEDSRLVELRFKELDMFTEEHMLIEVDEPPAPTNSSSSSSSSSTALIVSCTQSQTTNVLQAPSPQQMSQLQLPSIVIQMDGNDKGLSPVSSRSESPLSERASMGRFSPHFYGRKDLLPFTDSDGLYDFPSSDGKGTSSHPVYTHQRRASSKKRERKSSKCSSTLSPTKNQLMDDAPKESLNTTSSPSSCSITHICSKYCHSHHHPCTSSTTNVQRKSPKRRVLNRLPVASSSSSSESIASAKEMVMRPLPRRLNSPNREKRPRKQESLSEDEVADALLRRISPSIVKEEHPPKPNCKINRLRAIGNQIRFLRRLEKSIKTRERLASPSDSCPEEITDEMDSPQATSPLLQPATPTKSRIALCRQKRLPTENYSVTATELKPNTWRSADCHLISDDLNSD